MITKHNFTVKKESGNIDIASLGLIVTHFRIESPQPRVILTEVSKLDGAHVESVTQDVRGVDIGILTKGLSEQELDDVRHKVYELFYSESIYSILRDLNDTEIFVIQTEGFAPDRFTSDSEFFEINLKMVDPFIYKGGKVVSLISGGHVINEGSEVTYPTFKLTAKKKATFAMLNNDDDEYMLLGEPSDVDEVVVNSRELIMSEYGNTLSSWNSPNKGVDSRSHSVIAGSLAHDGTGIVASGYGTGSNWHGPAVTKRIPATQDFEIEMMLRAKTTNPNQTFRIEFYMMDEAMNVLGKMAILNSSSNAVNFKAEARHGDFEGRRINYHIDSRNYTKRESHFHGMLRVKRIGKRFEFYVARTGASSGGKHFDAVNRVFNDSLGMYQGKLRYIQIHIAKYGATGNPSLPRINSIRVYKHNRVLTDQTPYIVSAGDVVEIDHHNEAVFINGENAMPIKNFGADFFGLKYGYNTITITPADAFDVDVEYKERYK